MKNMKTWLTDTTKLYWKDMTNATNLNWRTTPNMTVNVTVDSWTYVQLTAISSNVIYKAEIITTNKHETQSYIAATANNFKTRCRNYCKSMAHMQKIFQWNWTG